MVHFNKQKDSFFKFIDPKKITQYCEVVGELKMNECGIDRDQFKISVTSLVNHLSSGLLRKLMKVINPITIKGKENQSKYILEPFLMSKFNSSDGIHIDNVQSGNQIELYEMVSPISGIAIVLYYIKEYFGVKHLDPYIEIIKKVIGNDKIFREGVIKFLYNYASINNLEEFLKISDSLKLIIGLSLLYYVTTNHCFEKLKQINNFSWIEEDILKGCSERINDFMKNDFSTKDKVNFESPKFRIYQDIKIYGSIDCESESTVWEFKCTNSIKDTHILQLAIYKWICNEPKEYKLYNPLLDEYVIINTSYEDLEKVIDKLIDIKFKSKDKNENDFIKENTLPMKERKFKNESNKILRNYHFPSNKYKYNSDEYQNQFKKRHSSLENIEFKSERSKKAKQDEDIQSSSDLQSETSSFSVIDSDNDLD